MIPSAKHPFYFCIFDPYMKLLDIILLSLAAGFIIIGIHQVMTVGFEKGYWAIMIAILFFFVYNLRKRK
jgi:amino acid permease